MTVDIWERVNILKNVIGTDKSVIFNMRKNNFANSVKLYYV